MHLTCLPSCNGNASQTDTLGEFYYSYFKCTRVTSVQTLNSRIPKLQIGYKRDVCHVSTNNTVSDHGATKHHSFSD